MTTSAVEARLGRPLNPDETDLAVALIGDVERMIARRLPSGDLTDLDIGAVTQVVGTAVARVLKNPEGYRSETAGGVSYTIDTRAAAGFLTILAEEWVTLGLSAPVMGPKPFSFGPTLGAPPPPWQDPWRSPWH